MNSEQDLYEFEFGGETLRCGTLEPDTLEDGVPLLSTAQGFRVWSRQEIEDAIRKKPRKRRDQFRGTEWIINQGQVGSCNFAAAVQAKRRNMVITGRNDVPQLSWEFGYALAVDGRDNGSTLDQSFRILADYGSPVLDLNRHPLNRHIAKRFYTAEDYASASQYKFEDRFRINTQEELATLILSGLGVAVVAVHVGRTFTSVDRDGFCGADSGMGNHAVLICDVEIINGQLAFDHAGSWGTRMHQDGYAYMTWDRHFAQTYRHHPFYAVISTSNPGGPKGE